MGRCATSDGGSRTSASNFEQYQKNAKKQHLRSARRAHWGLDMRLLL